MKEMEDALERFADENSPMVENLVGFDQGWREGWKTASARSAIRERFTEAALQGLILRAANSDLRATVECSDSGLPYRTWEAAHMDMETLANTAVRYADKLIEALNK